MNGIDDYEKKKRVQFIIAHVQSRTPRLNKCFWRKAIKANLLVHQLNRSDNNKISIIQKPMNNFNVHGTMAFYQHSLTIKGFIFILP